MKIIITDLTNFVLIVTFVVMMLIIFHQLMLSRKELKNGN